jgi:osmoprotectant transport system ATP-binding protein
MLMDEPFGAIDPINRERLQNEFLRLQAQVRKTVVFVTHDIDEAIKMGDRVAVLKRGGVLAQYATPAELLMHPADEFVEDFVGHDRALKRLALQRVRDIDLWKAATVREGDPVSWVRERLAEADLDTPLLVDEHDRPRGWLTERALTGERVQAHLGSRPEPVLELDDVLRDALADLISSASQYGPVVDAQGRVAGVLSVEVISQVLRTAPDEARSSVELLSP